MAREEFIPVADDDWYQRRRQDAEGEFFRRVADQGPRRGEGATRQGIYCLTADGKLLEYRNAGQLPDVMRDMLRRALAAYRRLPEAQRQPGAVQVEALKQTDPTYTRTPPPKGLIVNVYTRALEKSAEGDLQPCSGTRGIKVGAARDHLWLTESEWRSLLPAAPVAGKSCPVPAHLAERIARFHLVDNTRGEPPLWRPDEVQKLTMTLTVEEVQPARVRLKLDGAVLLSTQGGPGRSERGYDVGLLGWIDYDRGKDAITRFDVVALGDHWGEGPFTRGARPGRTPLGVAFELARGDSPTDRVPPQAARTTSDYFGRGR